MTDDQIEFGSAGIEDGTRRQVIFPMRWRCEPSRDHSIPCHGQGNRGALGECVRPMTSRSEAKQSHHTCKRCDSLSYLLLAVRQEVGVGLEVTREIVLDIEHETERG
jgi:hypothetical protein